MNDESAVETWEIVYDEDDGEFYFLDAEVMGDLNNLEGKEEVLEYETETFEVALDSGAGGHVADKKHAPRYEVKESAGSRRGQNFVTAGAHRLRNQGQFVLALRSGGSQRGRGRNISSTFQVAQVTRPLWSVSKICDDGFDVKFTKHDARIIDAKGRMVCKFERRGGLYVAQLRLKNPKTKDFIRPGA